METILYVTTAVLAVAWSVYTYLSWSEQERRSQYVVGRFFLMIGPSAYFLLLILGGWSRDKALRLDLVGIAALDVVTAVCWLGLLLARAVRSENRKRAMRFFLVAYHVLGALLVLTVFLVHAFPPLRIPLTLWLQQILHGDFLRLAWTGLNPEARQQDVGALANKVLIALLSYIPVSLIRSLLVSRQISRQHRGTYQELKELKDRVAELERRAGTSPQAGAECKAGAAGKGPETELERRAKSTSPETGPEPRRGEGSP